VSRQTPKASEATKGIPPARPATKSKRQPSPSTAEDPCRGLQQVTRTRKASGGGRHAAVKTSTTKPPTTKPPLYAKRPSGKAVFQLRRLPARPPGKTRWVPPSCLRRWSLAARTAAAGKMFRQRPMPRATKGKEKPRGGPRALASIRVGPKGGVHREDSDSARSTQEIARIQSVAPRRRSSWPRKIARPVLA